MNRISTATLSVAIAATTFLFHGGLIGAESNMRKMKYTSGTKQQTDRWQNETRSNLVALLNLGDLLARKTHIPFDAKTLSSADRGDYVFEEREINSTRDRRIRVVLTLPTKRKGPFAAVICVAGHGGTDHRCYEEGHGYFRMGHVLATNGYVTISTTVSQHEVREKTRTLTGERLWDLIRCVDYLESLKEVDPHRIGCAGKSLGGQMAMWLGAVDQRVRVTVSSGFLTRMDEMERGHCMCWKTPGLRELVDFADIYGLIAPRALLCQNGMKEKAGGGFPVDLARVALKEIEPIYQALEAPQNLEFVAHKEGHVFDLPSLQSFLEKHLKRAIDEVQPTSPGDGTKRAAPEK